MPPQQTNLRSEPGRDAAGLGLDLSIGLVKDAMSDVMVAARRDASVAVLSDALSEEEAAGPPAAPTQRVLGLLGRCWLAFQDNRRRRRLRISLGDLSERQLVDIGLTSRDIDDIAAHRAIERLRDNMNYLLMSRGVM